eukprot:gene9036-1134_t
MEQGTMNICKACTYYCEDCYSDDTGPQPYKKRTPKIESEVEGYCFFTFESLRTSNPGFISKNDLIFENLDPNSFPDIPSVESYRKSKKTEENVSSTIKIPMRSKYCKRCENYISKFDHHCFWIGRCVGEKNHYQFMRFLLFQVILISIVVLLAINGEYNIYLKMSKIQFAENSAARNPKLLIENSENLWLVFKAVCIAIGGFIAFFIMWLPLIMMSYNIFLISTNQTSYEIDRPKKCDYFDGVPRNSAKFDDGVINNWKDFYSGGNSEKHSIWKISKEPASNCCRSFCFCCIDENGSCCCD